MARRGAVAERVAAAQHAYAGDASPAGALHHDWRGDAFKLTLPGLVR